MSFNYLIRWHILVLLKAGLNQNQIAKKVGVIIDLYLHDELIMFAREL